MCGVFFWATEKKNIWVGRVQLSVSSVSCLIYYVVLLKATHADNVNNVLTMEAVWLLFLGSAWQVSCYVYTAPTLGHISSCMHASHGPWQHNCKRRSKHVEMRCFSKTLGISYIDHITNEEVRRTIRQHVSQYEDLLTTVKKRKWYGPVTRSSGLSKDHPPRNSAGERGDGGDRRKNGQIIIAEWTGKSFAHNRQRWSQLVQRSSWQPSPLRPWRVTGPVNSEQWTAVCGSVGQTRRAF